MNKYNDDVLIDVRDPDCPPDAFIFYEGDDDDLVRLAAREMELFWAIESPNAAPDWEGKVARAEARMRQEERLRPPGTFRAFCEAHGIPLHRAHDGAVAAVPRNNADVFFDLVRVISIEVAPDNSFSL